ncbi:cytochrome bd-I oxidase subunit CydX, partial [Delftia tsuruhatensis]
ACCAARSTRWPSSRAAATRTDPPNQETTVNVKKGHNTMWYFAWLLGLPLAAAFAVLNAMWYELMDDEATRRELLAREK